MPLTFSLDTTAAAPTPPPNNAAAAPPTTTAAAPFSLATITVKHEIDFASLRNALLFALGLWLGGKIVLMILSYALEKK